MLDSRMIVYGTVRNAATGVIINDDHHHILNILNDARTFLRSVAYPTDGAICCLDHLVTPYAVDEGDTDIDDCRCVRDLDDGECDA